MDKDEAMKQAKTLVTILLTDDVISKQEAEILRQALEQPELKPVAWVGEAEGGYRELGWDKADLQLDYPFVYPLYAAPPKQPKTNQCGEVCERAKLCYACGFLKLPMRESDDV